MSNVKEDGFLTKAMELCNSMMQFSGCELYSHNTRALLEGMKSVLNTIDGDEDKVGSILLLIDTLLEEEGIAEDEMLASCDPEPYYEEYPEEECYGPDPMESAEAAFDYLEEEKIESWYHDLGEYDDIDLAEMQDAEEIESWANTPHEDMNQDLKDALTALNNIRITKAIWSAREHMMSKIVFDNDDTYPIHHISFEVDENGVPVDICITTRWQYLEYIAANHCQLGYNCNDEERHGFYEGLFGRLDSFRVFDYKGNLLWQYDPKATRTYRF